MRTIKRGLYLGSDGDNGGAALVRADDSGKRRVAFGVRHRLTRMHSDDALLAVFHAQLLVQLVDRLCREAEHKGHAVADATGHRCACRGRQSDVGAADRVDAEMIVEVLAQNREALLFASLEYASTLRSHQHTRDRESEDRERQRDRAERRRV